ncbi:MAG TPA: hypothetical protein VHS52_01975 [Acidimicrobiales bacterium]|nr:hypothetical protein [Acidimicrobiales bacterium]
MTTETAGRRRGPVLRRALVAGLVVIAAGCGSSSKPAVTGGSTTTVSPASSATSGPTTVAPGATSARSATGTATTANGTYRIALTVGDRSPAGAPTACAPSPVAGKTALAVTVTVSNEGGASSPFPALRVELNAGGSPAPVPVRDSSGTCSFTPHEPDIAGGASVVLPGATPAIADSAGPGSAGRVEVAISESAFSVGVPVP